MRFFNEEKIWSHSRSLSSKGYFCHFLGNLRRNKKTTSEHTGKPGKGKSEIVEQIKNMFENMKQNIQQFEGENLGSETLTTANLREKLHKNEWPTDQKTKMRKELRITIASSADQCKKIIELIMKHKNIKTLSPPIGDNDKLDNTLRLRIQNQIKNLSKKISKFEKSIKNSDTKSFHEHMKRNAEEWIETCNGLIKDSESLSNGTGFVTLCVEENLEPEDIKGNTGKWLIDLRKSIIKITNASGADTKDISNMRNIFVNAWYIKSKNPFSKSAIEIALSQKECKDNFIYITSHLEALIAIINS